MFGIPLFRRATSRVDCEECRRSFPVTEGGVCSACGRILCPEHLHGHSWFRRALVELGQQPVCARCRSGGAALG